MLFGHPATLHRTSPHTVNRQAILGLTMGDPAGIGPELCVRVLMDPSVRDYCVPVLFGDAAVLTRLEEHGLGRLEARVCSLEEWRGLKDVTEPLFVDCGAIDPADVVYSC